MEELWFLCLRRLESELSDADLSTYIRPLQPARDGERLLLRAPNPVVQRRVRDAFLPQIRRCLSAVAGEDGPEVELTVGVPPALESHGTNGAEAGSPIVESTVPPPRAMTRLNAAYTFETFIEGKSNAQARAAAQAVADAPGGKFNPLLIYGDSGVGKTHLMHAIGNRLRARDSKRRVIYVGAERFVRDLISALRNTSNDPDATEKFKSHYRQADALLIDDIHFFAGKQVSQEEFFHTFNELLDGGQQMVLTCDRYPAELDGLDKRLRSRFTWGLSVPVEPPELETRVAILLSKAEQSGVRLPDDVAFFVAQRIRSNVRELEGALHRLSASAQITGRPMTVDFARETLKDMLAAYERLITTDNIKRQVSQYYNIRVSDLSSPRRNRSLARPRQIAMCLVKELTAHSLPEIGQAFGKDHTTVLHACRKVATLRKEDPRIREDYENLLRLLSY